MTTSTEVKTVTNALIEVRVTAIVNTSMTPSWDEHSAHRALSNAFAAAQAIANKETKV